LPTIDEEILSNLMHRATSDLCAPQEVTTRVVTSARHRTMRTRSLTATAAGVAAVTAIGVAVTTAGTGSTTSGPGHRHVPAPPVKLTAAVRTLNKLSAAAASTTQSTERYVEMSELQGSDKRTSVIDSQNGDIWTYQQGQGIPSELPVYKAGSPTEAQFDAYPTAMPALRSFLIRQARQQNAAGLRAMKAELKKKHIKYKPFPAEIKETPDDLVFSQAMYLLWNPLVGPSLRSALFKVLAATPGVVVNSHAKDALGRPAIEISRYDKAANYTGEVFESPDASAVLETNSFYAATKPKDGLAGEAARNESDVYQKITWSSTLPPNPYDS